MLELQTFSNLHRHQMLERKYVLWRSITKNLQQWFQDVCGKAEIISFIIIRKKNMFNLWFALFFCLEYNKGYYRLIKKTAQLLDNHSSISIDPRAKDGKKRDNKIFRALLWGIVLLCRPNMTIDMIKRKKWFSENLTICYKKAGKCKIWHYLKISVLFFYPIFRHTGSSIYFCPSQ